jgi:hypothetical protein
MLKKAVILGVSALSAMAMHHADININNTDIEGGIRFDMGEFNHAFDPETYMAGFRILAGDEENTDDLGRDIEPLYELNFLLQNSVAGNRNLRFGMGVKFEYTSVNNLDYMALPLGIEAAYRLPLNFALPIHVGGSFYFAPEVLAFSDAKYYREARIYADMEVIKYGSVTVGYRSIDTDYDVDNGDANYNSSLYAGFKFAF